MSRDFNTGDIVQVTSAPKGLEEWVGRRVALGNPAIFRSESWHVKWHDFSAVINENCLKHYDKPEGYQKQKKIVSIAGRAKELLRKDPESPSFADLLIMRNAQLLDILQRLVKAEDDRYINVYSMSTVDRKLWDEAKEIIRGE